MIPDDCWCYTILPFCNDKICRCFFITCKYSRMLVLEHLKSEERYIAAITESSAKIYDYIGISTGFEYCLRKDDVIFVIKYPCDVCLIKLGDKYEQSDENFYTNVYKIEYIASTPQWSSWTKGFKGYDYAGIIFSSIDPYCGTRLKMSQCEVIELAKMIDIHFCEYFNPDYHDYSNVIELNNKELLFEVRYQDCKPIGGNDIIIYRDTIRN